nr:hypothetical protein [Pantoea agglomerans]
MSEFKGTPGPWEVEDNTCYFSIESEGGGIGDVCMSGHVFDGGDCLGSTSKANAYLIAAAPELLEACLRMRNQLQATGYEAEKGSLNPTKCLLAQVEEAISKALGQ